MYRPAGSILTWHLVVFGKLASSIEGTGFNPPLRKTLSSQQIRARS